MLSTFNKILLVGAVLWLSMIFYFTRSPKEHWYSLTKKDVKTTCSLETWDKTGKDLDSIKQLCDCVVDRLERKHTPSELNELKHDELDRLGLVCISGDSLMEHTHLAKNSQWKITEKIAFMASCTNYLKQNNVNGIYNKLKINQYCNCMAEKLETSQPYSQTLSQSPNTLIELVKSCK